MRLVHDSKIRPVVVGGDKGEVVLRDVLAEEGFVLGLRETGPNCLVPKSPHKHPLRQAMYVIEGSGTVSNGKESIAFAAGDFILFDENEEHYFDSGGHSLKMIEVRVR